MSREGENIMQFTDTASAGNGGVATSAANGGAVSIGDVNSGGNAGNAIGIGDTSGGSVAADGGDVANLTNIGVTRMAAPPFPTPLAGTTTSPSSVSHSASEREGAPQRDPHRPGLVPGLWFKKCRRANTRPLGVSKIRPVVPVHIPPSRNAVLIAQ